MMTYYMTIFLNIVGFVAQLFAVGGFVAALMGSAAFVVPDSTLIVVVNLEILAIVAWTGSYAINALERHRQAHERFLEGLAADVVRDLLENLRRGK